MAAHSHFKAFTLRDLKVAPITTDTDSAYTPGALVDVPGIRECQVTIANDSVQLEGDAKVLAVVDQGNTYEFSLEAGGLSLEALEIMLGGDLATTGTSPNEVVRWDSKSDDARPYFALVGVTRSDDGTQDIHVTLYKAKITGNFEVTFAYGEFATPTLEGAGVGRTVDDVALSIVIHETPAAAAVETVS